MRGLDAAAFGLLLGMAIGRIGDLINGEHWSKETSLWWGVAYSNIESPGWSRLQTPVHPATTYEMIGDLLIIGIMCVRLRARRGGTGRASRSSRGWCCTRRCASA